MVRRLETVEGVAGIELGLPSGVDTRAACALAQAAGGELPVIVRLPVERAAELALRPGPPGQGNQYRRDQPGPATRRSARPGRRAGLRAALRPGDFPPGSGGAPRGYCQPACPSSAAEAFILWSRLKPCSPQAAVAVELDAVLWKGGLESG